MPVKTDYKYITKDPTICGGSPIVRGTRVTVRAIVEYSKLDMSPEEILEAIPHLTLSKIYSALAYYYDHKQEIEDEIRENIAYSRYAKT